MTIDVFGGIYKDVYIYDYGKKIERIEIIGGSGLNIALGLHILGHKVKLNGNIGNDKRGEEIIRILEEYQFPIDKIKRKEGYTGIFIAKNDKVFRIKRGVNDLDIRSKNDNPNKCAVVTTEITQQSIDNIFKDRWRRIFIDIGPRPNILKDIKMSRRSFKIGNNNESETISCDIIKEGPNGATWKPIKVQGNMKIYSHTIGAGDLFDTILIHNYLSKVKRSKSLEIAVDLCEKACEIKGGFLNKVEYLIKNKLL